MTRLSGRRETGQGVLGGSGADERQLSCRPFAAGAAPHHMSAMPYHRFKVGQTVVAPFGGPHALISRGPYVVLRLLPLVDGQPQYRVRSTVDGHERVVTEQRIRTVETSPTTTKSEPPGPIRGRR